MKTIIERMRERLLENLGIVDPLEINNEWSSKFESLCRNLLVIGGFRYGQLGHWSKPQWDRMSDIEKRVQLYRSTGNVVYLADISNMAMLEYEEGNHPKRHVDYEGDGFHTKIKKGAWTNVGKRRKTD